MSDPVALLEDVHLSRGGALLLRGVTARIPAAGITVLMGPNGAGKSLTLRVLSGLVAPDTGRVCVGGRAPRPPVTSLVFQRPVLLRRTVRGNLDHALKVTGGQRSRLTELLEIGGLTGLADQPARTLSGGEQQRLALVRALAGGPSVLLLDEPTASLDPSATKTIEGLLRDRIAPGIKVILVTHDLFQAERLADDVVFLHQGRVAEAGPAAEFFANPRSPEARAYTDGRLLV